MTSFRKVRKSVRRAFHETRAYCTELCKEPKNVISGTPDWRFSRSYYVTHEQKDRYCLHLQLTFLISKKPS